MVWQGHNMVMMTMLNNSSDGCADGWVTTMIILIMMIIKITNISVKCNKRVSF